MLPSYQSKKPLFLPRRRLQLLSIAMAGCALIGAALTVQASTFVPTSGTGHNWNDANNWLPTGVPNATDASAVFIASATGAVNLMETFTVGSLSFDITAASWTVGGAGKIRLDTTDAGVNPSLHVKGGAATSRTLTFQAGLLDATGPGVKKGLDITGEGASRSIVHFTGDNTGFTGGFNLRATTAQSVIFSTEETLGSNEVRVYGNNYHLRLGSNAISSDWSFSNNITIGGTKVGIYANAKSGYKTTLSGTISGSGGVEFWTYYGGGLELTGNNTYTGTSLVVGSVSLTFHDVSNFGTGNIINFASSGSASPTLVFAEGNTSDITLKANGTTQRTVDLRNAQAKFDTGLNNVTFSNALTGSFPESGVIKAGEGTLRLKGSNGQRSVTTVEAGTLLISNVAGSGTGTSLVTVEDGAILGGIGTARPTGGNSIIVQAGGTLAPGDSLEVDTIGDLTFDLSGTTGQLVFEDTSKLAFELTSGLRSDTLVILGSEAGSISFEGTTTLSLSILGSGLEDGDYTILQAGANNIYSGLTVDEHNRITGGLLIGAGLSGYDTSLWLDDGNVVLSIQQAIPEPSSIVMLSALGVLAAAARFRRRG